MPIVLRSVKGSPLTNAEVDGNFTDLDGRVSAAKSTADAAQPKVAGKGLSTNDYTTTEKTKLSGIAIGATANSSDATLLNRANHTGTQLAATISNFAAATLSVALSGLSLATGTAVVATDSILVAIGKLQAQATAAATAAATALRSVTPAADTIAYFTGATAAATSAFTAKARSLLARTDTAGMQAELALVPVSSSTDTAVGRLVTVGYRGLGAQDNGFFLGVSLNPDSYRAGGAALGSFVISGFSTMSGSLVTVAGSATTVCTQSFTNWGDGQQYNRAQNSGNWGPWRKQYDDANSLQDPQTSGGLMSSTAVSGWTIEKFANGTCIVAGAFTSASLAANSQTSIDTTIPSVLVGETVAGVLAAALPTSSIDVGAVNAFMVGNTTVRIHARNGATAQAILFRIKITGRWKA